MTPIRILIYTDYDQIDDNEDPQGWGITELRKLITYKTRRFADFVVERRYRFESMPRPLRLTSDFLCQYDQLWVLAFNNARMAPFELDKEEVNALFEWMNRGGGLMVAGDHAAGFCDIGNLKTFGVHGRSLGEPMKRAGQLRKWVGPPTACTDKPLPDRDNYNTCEGDDPEELDLIDSQSDAKPAKLLKLRGKPHSLFIISETKDAKINLIERFPDHPHESQLLELTTLNDDWPPGSPLPVTAAKARDKRFPAQQRDYPLVIAWDGPGQYGRIVADSSFHHYLNLNLAGIPKRDSGGFPVRNSALDQIGNFYRNLALWLLPRDKRNRMKLNVLYRLAIDPDVFEVRGTGYASLGRAAQYVINQKWRLEDLNWLICHAESDYSKNLDSLLSELLLANFSNKLSRDQAIILGAVVDAFHQDFAAQGAVTPDWLKQQPDPLEMITNALESLRAIKSSEGEKLLSLLQKIH